MGLPEPVSGAWRHLGVPAAAGPGMGSAPGGGRTIRRARRAGSQAAASMRPVRRSASGGHRDPAARDGEARRGAEHALGKAPQAPAGAGHALQHGALDVHDLVAEAGEQQAHLLQAKASTPSRAS